MRVLVLGGTGMLGHQLVRVFSQRFDVTSTVRGPDVRAAEELARTGRVITSVTAEDLDSVARAIADARPDVVVNCIGLVKQLRTGTDPLPDLLINAVFPHRLAGLCRAARASLIHISTDCVFAGTKGAYVETDVADACDLYGRTKFLGEVSGPGCLTIRTSLIGPELHSHHGLLDWFLAQRGSVRGYTRAVFSGVTTLAFAEILERLLGRPRMLEGLWHFSSTPISKFDLLSLIRDRFGLELLIEPDASVVYDRSLDSGRFRAATGLSAPPWPEMIQHMHEAMSTLATTEVRC
jgi:dTDP-4-dehydrorhamnose reductase